MTLSEAIGYHFLHIFHIHGKNNSVILSAKEDDCIPFYFWYLENMHEENDLKSSFDYISMPKERNMYAHRLTCAECHRLLSDWEEILETGYRCKDPGFYSGMFSFKRPLLVTSQEEQKRIKLELEYLKKLTEENDWNEGEIVLVIASDDPRAGIIRSHMTV